MTVSSTDMNSLPSPVSLMYTFFRPGLELIWAHRKAMNIKTPTVSKTYATQPTHPDMALAETSTTFGASLGESIALCRIALYSWDNPFFLSLKTFSALCCKCILSTELNDLSFKAAHNTLHAWARKKTVRYYCTPPKIENDTMRISPKTGHDLFLKCEYSALTPPLFKIF